MRLKGLKDVMMRFDKHGWKGNFRQGAWRIANGGYDLWFELYYKETPIMQCIAGIIHYTAPEHLGLFEADGKKLIAKTLECFPHLKVGTI